MEKIKIMVTGAGGAASIGFCRSLNDANTNYEIIGVDCNKYHLNLAEVDHRYLVPCVNDPDYIDILNYIIKKHQIDFLHSQPDVEIEFLSAHREDLKVKTNFPSENTVRICTNKWESYKRWKDAGIKVPKTLFIQNEKDLSSAFKELGGNIWVRDIKGAGGKGSLPTSNTKEAIAWVNFCDGFGHFTAAELLSKRTVTWSSIWDNGQLIIAQTRERMYWEYSNNSSSGVTGMTGTGITVDDETVNNVAIASIFAIDPVPHGIFSVDMTYDFNGIPNPTEINIARFFTTHYFFTSAGINFPDIFVRNFLGLPIKKLKKKINPLPEGLAWIRGMDSKPVLVGTSRFLQLEKELDDFRSQIRK
jgi:carbamoyl-phosphate synthase large subunit